MVARDHAHLDPRGVGLLDRELRLGARGVDDAHEGQERKVADERQEVRRGVEFLRVEVALGGCHDPQTLGAEALVLHHVRAADLRDRHGAAVR